MEEKIDVVQQEKMTGSYWNLMESLGITRNVVEYVISEVNDYGERETYVIQVRRDKEVY
jgi:hypothetical protein